MNRSVPGTRIDHGAILIRLWSFNRSLINRIPRIWWQLSVYYALAGPPTRVNSCYNVSRRGWDAIVPARFDTRHPCIIRSFSAKCTPRFCDIPLDRDIYFNYSSRGKFAWNIPIVRVYVCVLCDNTGYFV